MTGLIADIGGTNSRFAILPDDGGAPVAEQVMPTAAFPGFAAAAQAYLRQTGLSEPVRRAAICVACPVTGDAVSLTNLPGWTLSQSADRQTLGLDRLDVVNDFQAVALAVPHLTDADQLVLSAGNPQPWTAAAPVAVLGAGTGMGQALLLPPAATGGADWVAVPTEGGHATLAASTPEEAAILDRLHREHHHISVERLLSGPGLVVLHRIRAELAGKDDPGLSAEQISDAALRGDSDALSTLSCFLGWLGSHAGSTVLTLGGWGGVVFAGGLLPRWTRLLPVMPLLSRFVAKGRFRALLGDVPVRLITHPYPAFVGLAGLVRR